MKTKPELLKPEDIEFVIRKILLKELDRHTRPSDVVHLDLARAANPPESYVAARMAISDLGRDKAIELEALMYFGRGDYDTYAQAHTAMNLAKYDEFGAADQVAGKGASAVEYIATGLARLALSEAK